MRTEVKKYLSALMLVAALFAITACGNDAQEQVQGETVADYYTVIQSLAGIWDWPDGAGNQVFICNAGAWEHIPGDVGLYGNVSIAEYYGDFLLEFTVTRAEGPGAFGWIPPGETSPASGTEDGWRYGDVWGRGVYSPTFSELHLENWDGSMLLMERSR